MIGSTDLPGDGSKQITESGLHFIPGKLMTSEHRTSVLAHQVIPEAREVWRSEALAAVVTA